MDNIDVQILGCLQENARMNASMIGERINMSVSAVIERIKKLEGAGIIRQYTIVLDNRQIGLDLCVYISLGMEHPKYNEKFMESVSKMEEVVECQYITGDFDFLLKVITYSTQTLERILNDLKSIPGVSLTRTSIVLSTVKNGFSALPQEPLK